MSRLIKLLRLFFKFLLLFLAYLDKLTASRENFVLDSKIRQVKKSSKFLIYAHWSKSMNPSSGESTLLKEFSNQNIETVVVLNLDPGINIRLVLQKWSVLADHVIIRRNKGRDLSAYRTGWQFIRKYQPSEVYYLNNSVAWLPSKIPSFVNTVISTPSEILGITDSELPIKHIQSYGLFSKGAGVVLLGERLDRIKNFRMKTSTIAFGEVRLFYRAGTDSLNKTVLYNYQDLAKEAFNHNFKLEDILYKKLPTIKRLDTIAYSVKRGIPLNPSHFFWLEMYTLGFPGVKKELFRKNPSFIDDLFQAESYFTKVDQKEFASYGFRAEIQPKSIFLIIRKFLKI